MKRKLLAGLATAGLTVGGAFLATPAQATIYHLDNGGIREKLTCEDAGSVPYKVKVDWLYKYRDAALVLRASVNPLKIERPDEDAGPAAEAGVDLRYRVYSGNTKIQDVSLNGVDLDFAVDDQLTVNPRNPRSLAGVTRITVIVGTDGDGLGNCPLLTFYQPAGLPLNSVV